MGSDSPVVDLTVFDGGGRSLDADEVEELCAVFLQHSVKQQKSGFFAPENQDTVRKIFDAARKVGRVPAVLDQLVQDVKFLNAFHKSGTAVGGFFEALDLRPEEVNQDGVGVGRLAERYFLTLMDFVRHGAAENFHRPTRGLGVLKDVMKAQFPMDFEEFAYKHAKRMKIGVIALAMQFDEGLRYDDFPHDRKAIEREQERLEEASSIDVYAEALLVESVTAGPDLLDVAVTKPERALMAEEYIFALHVVKTLEEGGYVRKPGAGAYEGGNYDFALRRDMGQLLDAVPESVAYSDQALRLRGWVEDRYQAYDAFVLE